MQVLDKLEEVRKLLTKPGNMQIHMAANVNTLSKKSKPEKPWLQQFLPKEAKPSKNKFLYFINDFCFNKTD